MLAAAQCAQLPGRSTDSCGIDRLLRRTIVAQSKARQRAACIVDSKHLLGKQQYDMTACCQAHCHMCHLLQDQDTFLLATQQPSTLAAEMQVSPGEDGSQDICGCSAHPVTLCCA